MKNAIIIFIAAPLFVTANGEYVVYVKTLKFYERPLTLELGDVYDKHVIHIPQNSVFPKHFYGSLFCCCVYFQILVHSQVLTADDSGCSHIN